MNSHTRLISRRQIDKKLGLMSLVPDFVTNMRRPERGWLKPLREALGMTATQFAKRLGVSQPRISAIEKAEASKSITLETLERAANALDCDLHYFILPRSGSLKDQVQEQAIKAAWQKLKSTKHNMALEKQSVDYDDEQEQISHIAKTLVEKSDSSMWEVE